MATSGRRKSTSISERLFNEPFRFSFFQATRLLQGLVCKWQKKGKSNPVGRDILPQDESVRFASFLSLRFASSDIAKIELHQRIVKTDKQDIAEIKVSFMGLTGQSGVLPAYLTEMQLQRIREKDTSYQDFLDLFNHRAVSFFYRAWEKYRLPFSYERVHLHKKNLSDPITQAFESLAGIAGPEIQKQLPLHPEELIFYLGMFSTQRRSANALESALTEYMNVPIQINQYQGEWMPLCDDDRCRLPIYPLGGENNCLGVDTVIGDKVYTMEGKFEIVIGPLKKTEFENMLPDSERMNALKKFTRMFVGVSQHFSLKYTLAGEAITPWILGEELDGSGRIGWNTWVLPKMKESDSQSDKQNVIKEISVDVSQ